jgi:two-component system sensor histidine kinase BaeS
MMLLDADKRVLIGRPEKAGGIELHAVDVGGTTVGYLGVVPGPALNDIADIEFVSEQKRQFFAIAGIMILVSAALAVPLAGGMTRRIRRIAAGARSLAAGRYETRVASGARDELGSLAGDFNELAGALEAAQSSRRQWVADVSHELRTPLAVLRAELEAIQDGVREPDARSVGALHGEVLRLGRLVDDLYNLSLADLGALSYRKEDVDPLAVLDTDLEGLSSEFSARNISVEWDRARDPRVIVHGDPGRLSQLWSNLLVNAQRYTDPGGVLRIEASVDGRELVLDFTDSAPGVPAEQLAHLFERFHRVEKSRGREHGGAGLGLAICSSIVSAHGGTIEARPSPLGGLWIRVRLPLS